MIAEGIEVFNRGEFWGAHEHWEHVWKHAEGPLKSHLKGMIQAAAAFVLLEKGRPNAAARVASRALHHLSLSLESGLTPGERVVVAGLEPLLALIAADHAGSATATHLEQARRLRARIEKEPALA